MVQKVKKAKAIVKKSECKVGDTTVPRILYVSNNFNLNTGYCYDDKTEILTDGGWKFFKDVCDDDKVATINLESENLEYQHFTDRIVQNYTGKMINFVGQNFDLTVTPNHNMLVKYDDGYKIRNIIGKRKNDSIKKWHFEKAGDLIKKTKYQLSCNNIRKLCGWTGEDNNLISKEAMALAGWYLAEGYINKYNGSVNISQSQSHNPKFCDEIKSLFEHFNIKYKYIKDKSTFYTYENSLRDFLIDFGRTSIDKKIPTKYKILGVDKLSCLLDSYLKGDGTKNASSEIFTASTISRRLADDIQEISIKLGKGCHIKYEKHSNVNNENSSFKSNYDFYRIFLQKEYTKGRIQREPKIIDYSGKIYCFTVPNHTLLVRRNGKTSFCGNSSCVRNFCNRLGKEFWVSHIGQQQAGAPFKPEGFNFDVFPYVDGNLNLLQTYIKNINPDVVIIQDDSFTSVKDGLHNIDFGKSKLIGYWPHDGELLASCSNKIVDKCDVIVAMTEFGKKKFEEEGYENVKMIHHGTDENNFKPLTEPEKQNKRVTIQEFLGKISGKAVSLENKFVVYSTGRNTLRKQWVNLLRSWCKFAEGKDDVSLVINSINFNSVDQNMQVYVEKTIPKIDGTNGNEIKDGKIVFFPAQTYSRGVPVQMISDLTAMSDCTLFSALGEGFGMCCHPDTEIVVPVGRKSITELNVGDEVLTHFGRKKKITNLMSRVVDEPIFKITPWKFNEEVKLTGEHPVLVKYENQVRWTETKKLKKGDWLCYPRPKYKYYDSRFLCPDEIVSGLIRFGKRCYSYESKTNAYKKGRKIMVIPQAAKGFPTKILFEDLLKVGGYYLAEGCISKGEVIFCLNDAGDKVIKSDLKKILSDWGLSYREEHNTRNRYKLIVSGDILCRILKYYFGQHSKNKFINDELLYLSKDKIKSLLVSAFMGDGCLEKNKVTSYTTVSKDLHSCIRNMLLKIGIVASTKISKKRGSYVLWFVSTDNSSFNSAFDNVLIKGNGFYIDDDYAYVKIRNITSEKYSGEVYNFEVEGDNSYLTNSFAVHNCITESFFCKVPVISHDYTTPKYLVGEDKGFLFGSSDWFVGGWGIPHKQPDVKQGTAALEKAYALWKKGELKGKFDVGFDKFIKENTWDKTAEKWVDLIKEVVDGK